MTTQPRVRASSTRRPTPSLETGDRKWVKPSDQRARSLASSGRRTEPTTTGVATQGSTKRLLALSLLVAAIWSYGPTFMALAATWWRSADYAHGLLVLPLAAWILWARRDNCPGWGETSPWLALVLLAVSLALRFVGDVYFLTFLDGWSLVPWAGAVAAILGGRRLLWWAAPAIVFLTFMTPLPYSLEMGVSGPLQRVATVLSTQVLQFLGQPAFAEGNMIVLGEQSLEVAQACSGLRLLTGAAALAFVYAVTTHSTAWEKIVLLAAAVPIAITSNVARIVVTGVLYQHIADAATKHWIHDVAGRAMIVIAALQFWLLLWYLRQLWKEEEVVTMGDLVQHTAA